MKGKQDGNGPITLSRVVFVGSSLVLHSTCVDKKQIQSVKNLIEFDYELNIYKKLQNRIY